MLAATFEMAVSDAELRADGPLPGQDLGTGPGFETMPVGAVVGIPADRDVGALREEVDAAVRAGAARVRLKIEPGLGARAGARRPGGPPATWCSRSTPTVPSAAVTTTWPC